MILLFKEKQPYSLCEGLGAPQPTVQLISQILYMKEKKSVHSRTFCAQRQSK